ncbi:phospholipid phosphatase 3-like isoform X7 [Adelges cooleyi]|nr:phospholipid phosphatase 3-like isoform X7 [Adelges cooleyi]XP_050440850.1 phospholipid phosphatase 3-like isoform X7 [Adelges cooleyi]
MENNLFKNIIFEVSVVLITGITVLVTSYLEPITQGFFCDDESIKYQYKPSTISNNTLCFLNLFLPNVMIWFEYYWCKHTCIKHVYIHTLYFWLGSGLSHITVNVGKYCTGRLRPYFVEACKPNVECLIKEQYINNYTCTNPNLAITIESKKSFPSGHACLGFYSAVYTILYINNKYKKNVLIVTIQFIIFLTAWYIGLSRITDNMHFSTDVLAGSIIGTLFALLMMYNVKMLKSNEQDSVSNII